MADKKYTYEEAYEMAKKAGSKYPSVVAAQFGQESAWGTKPAGKNNFFNIKWNDGAAARLRKRGIKVSKSKSYTDNATGSEDSYMVFESPEDGFVGYQNFIETNSRYKDALKADTAQEYLQGIKDAGYAEDPNYVANVANIAKKNGGYDLTQEKRFDGTEDYKPTKEFSDKNYIEEARIKDVIENANDHQQNKAFKNRKDILTNQKRQVDKLNNERQRLQSENIWYEQERAMYKDTKARLDQLNSQKHSITLDANERKALFAEIKELEKELDKNEFQKSSKGGFINKQLPVQKENSKKIEAIQKEVTAIDPTNDISKRLEVANKAYETSQKAIDDRVIASSQEAAKIDTDEYLDTVDEEITTVKEKAVKEEEIKQSIVDEQVKKGAAEFDATFSEYQEGFSPGSEIDVQQDYAYEKGSFAQDLPLAALSQGALALIGLSEADTEIPKNDEKIGAATLAFLQRNRELSQKGMPLELEAKAREELATATKLGVDNLDRASGGNRNLVLANLGGLDVARAKGISALNIADMEAKDAAFARYGETLARIDEFESKKYNQNLQLDQTIAYQKQQEGKNLANAAFGQMLTEIQYQKENGPGSMKHAYQSQVAMDLWGHVPGMKDDGSGTKVGTKSYFDAQRKIAVEHNEKVAGADAENNRIKGIYATLTTEEKNQLQVRGLDPNTIDSAKIQSKDDLINYNPEDASLPEGYSAVGNQKQIDQDTWVDEQGVTHRAVGANGFSFDAKEKNQPGKSGLELASALEGETKAIKGFGKGPYGRDLTNTQVQLGGEWMDTSILQNRFDRVNYFDGVVPTTRDELIESGKRPYDVPVDPYQYRQSQK